jgi:oligopeptidase B
MQNHGIFRRDNYYWLRDKCDPEVIKYLDAENTYYRKVMGPLTGLSDQLFNELTANVPDHEVWTPKLYGGYLYYWRQTKSEPHFVYVRKPGDSYTQFGDGDEQVILDLNTYGNNSRIGIVNVSPKRRYFAFSLDDNSSERNTLYVKDLISGEISEHVVSDMFGGVAWSANEKYIFYVAKDENNRMSQLKRHKVGTTSSQDVLLLSEPDPSFSVKISVSQNYRYIFVTSESQTATETRVIDAENPLGSMELLARRTPGIKRYYEFWNNNFIVLTNENAPNFKILSFSKNDPATVAEIVTHSNERYLTDVHCFRDGLFVSGRADGATRLWRLNSNLTLDLVDWDKEVYSITVPSGQDYQALELVVRIESYLTPPTYYAIAIQGQERAQIFQQDFGCLGSLNDYIERRVAATAKDGTKIPIFLRYRKDALVNGSAPLILSAYGAAGKAQEPEFTATDFPLLNRGVVLAQAQIRGGSEFGPSWHYGGTLLNKRNTFDDYISAARYLIQNEFTSPSLLIGYGASAGGGLLCGVANMAGELFKVIIAEVPDADILNTLLDESIPHVGWWRQEWGNPENENVFRYILSYAPYENIRRKPYPVMYITAGLKDSRVNYWEPAKWVAKLRELNSNNQLILLKTDMDSGHFGSSNRDIYYQSLAEKYAFILNELRI